MAGAGTLILRLGVGWVPRTKPDGLAWCLNSPRTDTTSRLPSRTPGRRRSETLDRTLWTKFRTLMVKLSAAEWTPSSKKWRRCSAFFDALSQRPRLTRLLQLRHRRIFRIDRVSNNIHRSYNEANQCTVISRYLGKLLKYNRSKCVVNTS